MTSTDDAAAAKEKDGAGGELHGCLLLIQVMKVLSSDGMSKDPKNLFIFACRCRRSTGFARTALLVCNQS